MSSRRQSAPVANRPATPGSGQKGARRSMPGRRSTPAGGVPAAAKKNTAELIHGLFHWLDMNGDGVIEENEWAVGCKYSRSFFRGRQQPEIAITSTFEKLDSQGVGCLVYEDVEENVESILEAMGIPADQGMEALHLLEGRRAKEAASNAGQGALDAGMPGAPAKEEGEKPATSPSQVPQKKEGEEAELARVCSDRRAQVLRRFLAVIDTDESRESTEHCHLAIRAKRAAQRAVAGDVLQPPPEDMKVSVSMDALHAGGENVWVSAEISVAKNAGGVEGMEEDATWRVPADLLIVVDVSGSMDTSLPSVRKCLASLASLVDERDRLSIVKFDDQATLVMPWTEMDTTGVEDFKLAQKQLVSCGGTNYLPVFEKCFKELLDEPAVGRSRTMLFISDGAPAERDTEILRSFSSQLKLANLSVVSVGFGSGTKSDLMSTIAHCGCGPFVYIAEPKDIPRQLGRIWAAVVHTSLSSVFAVVRPLAGTRVNAVEGAFGSAELSLRPDGQPSSQQAMVVQLGSVRHGASREFAMQLKLPPHLMTTAKISREQLRQPLVEVSFISQAVAEGSPIFLQRMEFRVMQVPSLLMETMLPFPVRMVLDNNLEEFDAQKFLKHAAETFGVQEHELELTRVLQGSVIIDMHLKVEPSRAAQVFEDIAMPHFQQKMSKAMEDAGWKLKTMATPGQQVLRRVLQTRFAGALAAASQQCDNVDPPEIQAVQVLAASDVANFLDPPGPQSMAALVKQDCEVVLDHLRETKQSGGRKRSNLKHDLVQLQSAHLAQYKSEYAAASLECYEQAEAKEAADALESYTGDLSISASFWETVSESMEVHMHETTGDQMGVMVGLRPQLGRQKDFGHLVKEVCPVFEVSVEPTRGSASDMRISYAHPVSTDSMRPLLLRSCHPVSARASVDDIVRVPYAESLKVTIDPRSCRHGGTLAFYSDEARSHPLKAVNQKLISSRTPQSFWQFCAEGSQLWFSFRAPLDDGDAEWGYHFEVEAVMPTEEPAGILLQAGVCGLKVGSCSVSVRCLPQMFEIPAQSVQVRQLHGRATEVEDALKKLHAATSKSLLLNEVASNKLGFPCCARLLRINGEAASSKKQLTEHTGSAAVQLAFTVNTELHRLQNEALLRAKLRKVPDNIMNGLVKATLGEVLVPRRPEVVRWSWDGNILQLCWRYGWPPSTVMLRAAEICPCTLEPLSSLNAFFMMTPDVEVIADPSAQLENEFGSSKLHEPLRMAKLPIPAPLNSVLHLDIKQNPTPGQEPQHVCQFSAWLVPSGYQDVLEALTVGTAGKYRRLSQKALATLVIDEL